MQFIYITCNISMLDNISELLDEIEIANYQVIEQVTAKSHYAQPRLNTAVWPGFNASVLVQENDQDKIDALMTEVEAINSKAYNNGELIAAFQWGVDRFTNVKPIG